MAYNKVETEFWRDTLTWPEDERMLALYLLTCDAHRSEGLFPWMPETAGAEMRWPVGKVRKALKGLEGRGWAAYDADHGLVLLRNGLRWGRPDNPNQRTRVVRWLARQPLSPLIKAFRTAAQRFDPLLASEIDAALPELADASVDATVEQRLFEGFANGSGDGLNDGPGNGLALSSSNSNSSSSSRVRAPSRAVEPDELPPGLDPALADVASPVLSVLRRVWQARGGYEPTLRGVGLAVAAFPRRDHLHAAQGYEHWATAGGGANRDLRDHAARFRRWLAHEPDAVPTHADTGARKWPEWRPPQ